jgi:MFS family permease
LTGRLIWGAAWAGIWISASTIALDLSTGTNRGRFVGRLQMWFYTGVGVSSLAGGVLTDWLGYQNTFRVCFVVTLGMAVVWWLLLPETRSYGAAVVHTAAGSAHESPAVTRPKTLGLLLTAIVLMGVNWLIFMGILGAVLPLLLEERIGETVILAGVVIPLATFTGALAASNQAVSVLTSPLAGWFSDYSRQRWGLVLLALLVGVGATALTAVGTGGLIVAATMLAAVATSVLQTQVMTLIGDYAHTNRRGRILGVLNTVGDVGSASGPLLAYALLPLIALEGVFWLATAVLVFMLPWTVWAARRESRLSLFS